MTWRQNTLFKSSLLLEVLSNVLGVSPTVQAACPPAPEGAGPSFAQVFLSPGHRDSSDTACSSSDRHRGKPAGTYSALVSRAGVGLQSESAAPLVRLDPGASQAGAPSKSEPSLSPKDLVCFLHSVSPGRALPLNTLQRTLCLGEGFLPGTIFSFVLQNNHMGLLLLHLEHPDLHITPEET